MGVEVEGPVLLAMLSVGHLLLRDELPQECEAEKVVIQPKGS